MKRSGFLIVLILFAQSLFSQTKEDLIKTCATDTVVQYQGQGTLSLGNCLIIKFTGDVKTFFNELVLFHAQSEDQVIRTESTVEIYETTKPYWIYGKYSVFAESKAADGYNLIEVYFRGYSNPDHLKILGAAPEYQKLINKLLGK